MLASFFGKINFFKKVNQTMRKIFLILGWVLLIGFTACNNNSGSSVKPSEPAGDNSPMNPNDPGRSEEIGTISDRDKNPTPYQMNLNGFSVPKPTYITAKRIDEKSIVIQFIEITAGYYNTQVCYSDPYVGPKGLLAQIQIPIAAGVHKHPGTAKVLVKFKDETYTELDGEISISQISNTWVKGSFKLEQNSREKTNWTGSFSTIICGEEAAFLKDRNALYSGEIELEKSGEGYRNPKGQLYVQESYEDQSYRKQPGFYFKLDFYPTSKFDFLGYRAFYPRLYLINGFVVYEGQFGFVKIGTYDEGKMRFTSKIGNYQENTFDFIFANPLRPEFRVNGSKINRTQL